MKSGKSVCLAEQAMGREGQSPIRILCGLLTRNSLIKKGSPLYAVNLSFSVSGVILL